MKTATIREQSRIKEQRQEEQKRALCLVTDTKVPLFKDHFWHFQIKIKFRKKNTRQGSVRLPDADFFWIIS